MDISINSDLFIIIVCILALFAGYKIFNKFLFPIIVNKCTKEIEVNPKWIVDKIRKEYYGFDDIDFILAENPLGALPRFRISKNKEGHRLQFLISNETLTTEVEEVARIALIGKIKVNYGLWFPDKPLHWLSILCFMLDGGNIKMEDTKWEEIDKKPIDLL